MVQSGPPLRVDSVKILANHLIFFMSNLGVVVVVVVVVIVLLALKSLQSGERETRRERARDDVTWFKPTE